LRLRGFNDFVQGTPWHVHALANGFFRLQTRALFWLNIPA
jgi:hypothetical protein